MIAQKDVGEQIEEVEQDRHGDIVDRGEGCLDLNLLNLNLNLNLSLGDNLILKYNKDL